MGVDFVIHYACRPKTTLGEGDGVRGTIRLVELLKAQGMARYFEELARREGKELDTLSLTRHVRNATTGEVIEQPMTYRLLVEQTQVLAPLAPDCAQCPANILEENFGCYGSLRYPIAARSEQWLLDRLEPPDRPGGLLLLRAIADLGYTGEPLPRLRAGGLFELGESPERVLDPARPDETRVRADQIWHALLAVGPELQPDHCMMILTWIGALSLDGKVPTAPEHLQALVQLDTPQRRLDRTDAELGPPDQGPEVQVMRRLFVACYLSWLHGVPLLIDA